MDDVRAVMDAADAPSAAIMGWSEGVNIAALFAASYPERVEGLALYAGGARYRQAPDYPIGMSDDFIELGRDIIRNHWGEGMGAYLVAPSRAQDDNFRRWFGRYERLSVSPGQGEVMLDLNIALDTTEVFRSINVPTLILHNRRDAFVPVEGSRHLASLVTGARLVEMSGEDHLFWFHNPDEVVGELEDFFLGLRTDDVPNRVLSTVVFTDIVDSTGHASAKGDSRWRELLDRHDRVVRENVDHFQGRLVKMTGDGMLATFDGPVKGIRCASRVQRSLDSIGLLSRAAVHTGEIELRDGDVSGVAVHIAARLVDLARTGEVLVSRTVKDLAVGADVVFEDRGVHELQGLTESWRLFAASA